MSQKQTRRTRDRHGFYTTKSQLAQRGFGSVDRRTVAGRTASDFRDDLVVALGGEGAVTPQQMTIIEDLAVIRYLELCADSWLASQPTLLRGRGKAKSFVPLVRERVWLSGRKSQLLQMLGLERRPQPVKSLSEYLADRDNGQGKDSPEQERASGPGASGLAAPASRSENDIGEKV